MTQTPVIAIDGTAASGKGTLARRLAQELSFAWLDTGKLYRYVGYAMVRQGLDPSDGQKAAQMARTLRKTLTPQDLQDEALGSDVAGSAASVVAAIPDVRASLLEYQRHFAANPPGGARGAVLDGRDIGTIICPAADLKFFVDADAGIRAQRRWKELQSKGISATYDAVLADMQERDQRDAKRNTAPMKPATDAIMLDTSAMSADDVLKMAVGLARERLNI